MAKFTRFEDIEAWQKARTLTQNVYDISDKGVFAKDFPLRDQMRRAAISIMSNIAEGFERGGSREFLQFLAQAKGSAGELRAQLYVALDRSYVTKEQFSELAQLLLSISRMIAKLMQYLRDSDLRGSKYASPPKTTRSTLSHTKP